MFDLLRSSLKNTNLTSQHFILMAFKETKGTKAQRTTKKINILSTINKHLRGTELRLYCQVELATG